MLKDPTSAGTVKDQRVPETCASLPQMARQNVILKVKFWSVCVAALEKQWLIGQLAGVLLSESGWLCPGILQYGRDKCGQGAILHVCQWGWCPVVAPRESEWHEPVEHMLLSPRVAPRV